MNPLPLYYKPASVRRRFAAACVNFLVVGVMAIGASTIWGVPMGTHQKSIQVRLTLIAMLIAYWLLCSIYRSLGAAFFLLEVRTADYAPVPFKARCLRSLPFLVFGCVAYFPIWTAGREVLLVAAGVWSMLVLLGMGFFVVNAAMIFLGHESFMDRWLKLTVLNLSLPADKMPTVLGKRLM